MIGIIMKVNDELYVMIGRVDSVIDLGDRVEVSLEYEEFDRITNMGKSMFTKVFYRNQLSRTDEKDLIPFADRIRSMGLHEGSVVMTTLRFPGCSNEYANGYGCQYSGIIRFRGRTPKDCEYNVIYGVVEWQKNKQDNFRRAYTSVGIFLGEDKKGVPQNVVIIIKDRVLMNRFRALKLEDCGEKMAAAFQCGEIGIATSQNGENYNVYIAFDFKIIDA